VDVSGPQTAGATVSVGGVRPDLQSSSQDLVAVGPGRWQGRIGGTSVGTYLLHAALKTNGQVRAQADRAGSVPYSREYVQLGRDDGLLRQVARNGGGLVLAKAASAWAQRPLPVPISSEIFWPLILLAALLWPLDVAVRRITLSPRQLVANAVMLATERRMRGLDVAGPEEVGGGGGGGGGQAGKAAGAAAACGWDGGRISARRWASGWGGHPSGRHGCSAGPPARAAKGGGGTFGPPAGGQA